MIGRLRNIVLVLLLNGCSSGHDSWLIYVQGTGTYSSPRLSDLNSDGVLDIVIGAGAREERYSDTGVIAVDGRNGRVLWKIDGVNQYTGSAVFLDINSDSHSDVIIGGRWAQLTAIDGLTGKKIWSFLEDRSNADPSAIGWYNFTTPQIIEDQDGDNKPDILIANGGDAKAAAGDTLRPAGKLLIVGSSTGKIIAQAIVPDKKETYLSVVCDGENVYFGTGGESIGGNLYRTTIRDIIKGDLSSSKLLVAGLQKGFISSPVLADLNNDKVPDIIVNKVEGQMLVLNGKNDSILWSLSFPGTEAYTNPAIGFFNEDSVPDVFCNYAIGVFPDLKRSIRFLADGATGQILYKDTIRAFQYASAVVADINSDNYDDILINQSEGKRKQFEDRYYSYLYVMDFKNKQFYSIGDTVKATNFASTPWVGDMDGDGKLDIVHASVNYHDLHFDLEQPLGLFIGRIKTDAVVKRPIVWGAYMGSNYNNKFYE